MKNNSERFPLILDGMCHQLNSSKVDISSHQRSSYYGFELLRSYCMLFLLFFFLHPFTWRMCFSIAFVCILIIERI